MSTRSQQTDAQRADATSRRRDGRPDKTLMSNEERHAAGLMTRQEAAAHERLRGLINSHEAERVRRPDPDDPWASEATA